MTRHISATSVMAVFVLALAGRDILFDLWLRKSVGFIQPNGSTSHAGLAFATLTCALVSVAAAAVVTTQRGWATLAQRLRSRAVLTRSATMGALAGVIYGVTFTVIESLGAGLFNLIDWGFAPVLTAAIGIVLWKDRFRSGVLFAALLLGVTGIVGLYQYGALGKAIDQSGWGIVGIAILSPICTAVSFSLQRWLLLEERGGLTRAQVLVVRFVPATAVLIALSAAMAEGRIAVADPFVTIPVIGVAGGLPALLVCHALVRGALSRFAAWQFAIPSLAFLGTLHHYDENRSPATILFAFVMLSAVLLVELLGDEGPESSGVLASPDT
ncbi:MAG: hypothetical protein AAFZ87_02080 [Planctomycetota bacterium]